MDYLAGNVQLVIAIFAQILAHVVIKWSMSDEERRKINLKNDDRVAVTIVIFKYYYFIKRVCFM